MAVRKLGFLQAFGIWLCLIIIGRLALPSAIYAPVYQWSGLALLSWALYCRFVSGGCA